MKRYKWPVVAAVGILALALFTNAVGKSSAVNKTFKVKKGGDLVVDIENIGADVYVKVWDKLEVTVRAEGIPAEDLEYLEIAQDGNKVRVYYDAYGHRRHGNARFHFNVPSEFNLDLSTSGGDVEVTGAIKGFVQATTAGGDIEVDDVDGEVHLKTAGGDISAGSVNGDAELKTAGGDIEVGKVTGELVVTTAGGDIEAGEVTKNLEAKTAGGDIICENVGGTAIAKTAGGDIELGVVKGAVTLKTAGGDIEIDGATGEAVAKTAGGDIKLSGVKGYVDVATAGGDIYVELNPTNADRSDLETKGGDIGLYLPANAKATIEALIRIRGHWDDEEDYSIESDFKAETHDKSKNEIQARYVLNGGGKLITIETMNGNIEIRKQ